MAANPSLTNDLATEEAKGFYAGIATRLSFVSVGLWWAGFAQIMFKNVPEVHSNKTYDGNILNKGFEELKKVWLQVKQQPTMLKYLLGFFFTSMGVQTVMYVASLFGEEELHLDTGVLIGTILVIQLDSHIRRLGFFAYFGCHWQYLYAYYYHCYLDDYLLFSIQHTRYARIFYNRRGAS